jgi:transcriptional regulator with GAF, ATPase, and Fis domain
MDAAAAAHALARASAGLTAGCDVTGALRTLLDDGRIAFTVDAVGILVRTGGHLEPWAAVSTPGAVDLGIREVQLQGGPCLDAGTSARTVTATGLVDLATRWPSFAVSMADAGCGSVLAAPLRRHGEIIGALGLYRRSETPFTAEEDAFALAFADVVANLVAGTGGPSVSELAARCEGALGGRIVIEQAKGVLAQRHGLSMAEAYDLMLRSWAGGHETLAEWSSELVREADPG